jgi:hypothetical protein
MSYGDKTREILAFLDIATMSIPALGLAIILGRPVADTRSALMRLARLKKIGKEKHKGINYYRILK